MCGIIGWVDWETNLNEQKDIISDMTNTLKLRGPDATGYWFSERAAFGHQRLSVVDPEGGSQPMIIQKYGHKFVITYNGELYNTPQLRKELETVGHVFKTHSDTEVLLASYIEWREECVNRFNGIFAFSIWDEYDQSLFLARDRFGVKPLFYTQKGKRFLFGSEIKALLAHPEVKPIVNLEGIAEILYLGPARTPGYGVFKDIFELKPAHFLIYNGKGTNIYKYWHFKSAPHRDDLHSTIENVRELFKDSVERQLVADVPVCTFLSGGIDSSAITAIAANSFKSNGLGQLHTYSIDYVGNYEHFKANDYQPNSDTHWIKSVSDYLNTKHHYITVDTEELVEALSIALRARDLPGMSDIDSSLYLFCKEVKKEATVALSGECADEIFGGYPWFHREELMNAGTFPWSLALNERASIVSPEISKLINPEEYINQHYHDTLKEVPRLEGESNEDARRRELFYLNINWFMSTLLERKDRMSMATGLEVRVPFCDHRLMEYVWNIPWELKNHMGMEKGILRKALIGLLPDSVINRKKSPYPKTHNPAYLAAVSSLLRNILEDSSSPIHEIVNTNTLSLMLNSKELIFKRPWFGQLMNVPQLYAYMIQLDIWLREYKVQVK